MARTTTPKSGKPAAKPAAQWQVISLRLPTALVAEIDAIATKDRRPRVKMIEVMLDECVQSYRQRAAAP